MKRKNIAALAAAMMVAGTMSFGVAAEETQTEAVSETAAAEGQTEANADSQVASADEMAEPEEIVEDWMVPITADELNDGTYEVDVRSSSSMFKIVDCELQVEDGSMKAVMTMSGKGYLKVYMGTGEEATEALEEEMIPFVENEDGAHTFEVPVEALDQGIDCTAFSKKKEKWYDRVLVFEASSLPEEAFKELKMTAVADLNLEDGSYLVEAALSGGSGRTTVESPAEITVKDGEVTAQVVFSSPNYDYMLVNDEKYETVNTEGNSTFLIPVSGFDYQMPVIADTIAMSTPHEIEYTILFDSATIEKAE